MDVRAFKQQGAVQQLHGLVRPDWPARPSGAPQHDGLSLALLHTCANHKRMLVLLGQCCTLCLEQAGRKRSLRWRPACGLCQALYHHQINSTGYSRPISEGRPAHKCPFESNAVRLGCDASQDWCWGGQPAARRAPAGMLGVHDLTVLVKGRAAAAFPSRSATRASAACAAAPAQAGLDPEAYDPPRTTAAKGGCYESNRPPVWRQLSFL